MQAGAKAKFEETVEVSFKTGLDPRRSDQQVRGVVSLPHGTGKKLSVAVFAEGEQAEAALKAGAPSLLSPLVWTSVFPRIGASSQRHDALQQLGSGQPGTLYRQELSVAVFAEGKQAEQAASESRGPTSPHLPLPTLPSISTALPWKTTPLANAGPIVQARHLPAPLATKGPL